MSLLSIAQYTIPCGAYFSWSGTDNFTSPAQLMFSYALDSSWSGFGKHKSKSYTFDNESSHIFEVKKAMDEAKNVEPSPANYPFTISKK